MSTIPAGVQNVTTGTGLPAPAAGMNSRSNTAAAVANVGERKITIASVNAVNVSAMRNTVPGTDCKMVCTVAQVASRGSRKARWMIR